MLSLAPGLAVAAPFRSTGLGETPGARLGSVVSRCIVTLCEAVRVLVSASQVKVVPAVSVSRVTGSQPVVPVTVDSGSVTVQLTVTSLTYQPLLPGVPLMLGVITGGVLSGTSAIELGATPVGPCVAPLKSLRSRRAQ